MPEHAVCLVTPSRELAEAVSAEVEKQLEVLPRKRDCGAIDCGLWCHLCDRNSG